MDRMTMDVLRNLDLRLERVEQILPTLSTKDELAAAMAQLATKPELAAAVAPLATKAELAAAIAQLATKAELTAAIAPLASKAELAAAIAPLATKQELREESEDTRRQMRVLFESLHSDIQVVAEGVVHISQKLDAHRHPDLELRLDGIDVRMTALESGRRKRRAS